MNDTMLRATRSTTDHRPASSARPESLSDDQLLRRLGEITRDSRRVEAELVAHIGEVDARRLYAREGCSSMFAYCVELLHLSEPETNLRIVVARATRRHPILLEMLGDGRLHLSGIALLAPHLTETNLDEVLSRATHSSKRRIEELVAGLFACRLVVRSRLVVRGIVSSGRDELGIAHRRDSRKRHPERRGPRGLGGASGRSGTRAPDERRRAARP